MGMQDFGDPLRRVAGAPIGLRQAHEVGMEFVVLDPHRIGNMEVHGDPPHVGGAKPKSR
jgi:hypothetical protein